MMEANLSLRKVHNFWISLLAISIGSGAAADPRTTNVSVIKEIRTAKFLSILNEDLNPQMPPLFRGAVDQLIDSTVAVIGSNSNFGSGVVLSTEEVERFGLINKFGRGHYIATVEHVVSEDQDYAVAFYDENGIEFDASSVELAQVIGSVRGKDLALIKIANMPKHVSGSRLVTEKNKISIGDDVQAIGHPNEMWWTYTRGYVSQFRNDYEWIYEDESFTLNANVIQTQTPITTGNSGGPLFTKRGEILGLNAFGDPEFQSINFAISYDEIERFLSSLGKNQFIDIGLQDIVLPDPENWKKLEEFDLNEDGYIDAIAYDSNNDGKPDIAEIDEDYDGKTDFFEFDIFYDFGFAQKYFPETSEYYAEWRIDTDGDGKDDIVAYDENADGFPDALKKI